MADEIEQLLPADDAPLPEPDAELDALADSLASEGVDVDDLVVGLEAPPPVGRSWAFDFAEGRFLRAGREPLRTRGLGTIQAWIDKCLHTERGGSPVHPPEYGLEGVDRGIGSGPDDPAFADLEDRIRAALTFHPRIVGIEGFQQDFDPDDDVLAVRFVVVLDDDDRIPVQGGFGA